jgi:hypothetical protein
MNTAEDRHTGQVATLPGLFGRYIRVFTAPDILFQALRGQPEWASAMFLGAGLVAVGALLIPLDLTLATLREAIQAQGQPVPPGLQGQGALIRFAGPAAAFLFWPVLMAFFAGLVMLFFAILLGHEGTYRQYLAVVTHAHLIAATSGILLSPLRILMEDAQLLFSVGTFAAFLEPSYLLRFLSLLNLFSLWAWVLVALGAARIGRKKSWAFGCVSMLIIPATGAAVLAILTG